MSWSNECKDEHGNLDPVKCYDFGVRSTKEPWRKIGWYEGATFGFVASCALWIVLTAITWAIGGAS